MREKKTVSIAPMIDYSYRHFRYFMRLLTKKSWVYTEMITAMALLHGNAQRLLAFNKEESPVVCQLGGNEPEKLAKVAKVVDLYGYDEVNLNVGCPSPRVQSGAFGACLMKEPKLVADCIKAMKDVVDIPVTVKCRIGVDEHDSYDFFQNFVEVVAESGCQTFIIHARKAWLKGLNPKQNRTIPPLQYDAVIQLKKALPHLNIILNGGIEDAAILEKYPVLDGVMLGRKAIDDCYYFTKVDNYLLNSNDKIATRAEILGAYFPYIVNEYEQGENLNQLLKPVYSLYKGLPGAKRFRCFLAELSKQENPLKSLELFIEMLENSPLVLS